MYVLLLCLAMGLTRQIELLPGMHSSVLKQANGQPGKQDTRRETCNALAPVPSSCQPAALLSAYVASDLRLHYHRRVIITLLARMLVMSVSTICANVAQSQSERSPEAA